MAKEQEIWQQLLTVSERGFVRWAEDTGAVADVDSRYDPFRYMAMCGNLRALSEHEPTFSTDDLIEMRPNVLEAQNGEIAGLNGLLRLSGHFKSQIQKPHAILLVGAVTPNSLLSLFKWCQNMNLNESHITLVDVSPIPLRTLRLMQDQGYYSWPGGVELVNENIFTYKPSKQPSLIIADILNTWMVDKYQYPHLDKKSPFDTYQHFLSNVKDMLPKDGQFLSRCLITPSAETNIYPKPMPPLVQISERIIDQLGELSQNVSQQEITESVETLFNDPSPTTFCSLGSIHPLYKTVDVQSGAHAGQIYERIHRRTFPEIEFITVHDPRSGNTFQNYLCQP